MCLIKICGCTCPLNAQSCAALGADFIGVLCSSKSPRFVSQERAAEITQAVRKENKEVVLVFVDEEQEFILGYLETSGAKAVQLHGENGLRQAPFLPSDVMQIHIHDLKPSLLMSQVEAFADCFLLDRSPGKGPTCEWKDLELPQNKQIMLAGGLNKKNIREFVRQKQAYAIDLCSGLEGPTKGIKDLELVREFIDIVRAG
ncbi:MAG: hypothetical protein CMO81_03405 [Waddliaceae bacterium]|nr:hypothetical protein [Waddliaceae bacterium]